MWESRRDFQRVWEGWEAGFLAFHAFHTLSFPWPAFRPGDAGFTATSTSVKGRTRKEVFAVVVVLECLVIKHSLTNQCLSYVYALDHIGSTRLCLPPSA